MEVGLLKKVMIVLLFCIFSISAFSDLRATHNNILKGIENTFQMTFGPSAVDNPRYIGKYREIKLVIVGNKKSPKSTSLIFTFSDASKEPDFFTELLSTWMKNTIGLSSKEACYWTLNMLKINCDKKIYEYFRYFDSLKVTLEKTQNKKIIIKIEGEKFGEIVEEKKDYSSVKTPKDHPPSYLEEYNEWVKNDGKSKYMPSYYQYPHSNRISVEEEAQYEMLLNALMAGKLNTKFLPGSYQFAPMGIDWQKGNFSETVTPFILNPSESESIKTHNAPAKCKVVIETTPIIGGVISFDNRNWDNSLTKTLAKGESILLFAKAQDGYSFDGWYKNEYRISEDNPYILNINSYSMITAKFLKLCSLSVQNGKNVISKSLKIKISGKNIPSINSFQLHIKYDSRFIEPDYNAKRIVEFSGSIRNYKLFKVENDEKEGELLISGGVLSNKVCSVKDEIIIIINMKAKTKRGKTKISILETSKILGKAYQEIPVTVNSGVLVIE